VPSPWKRGGLALICLIFFQILLGALVAGNDAGFVYNDWPLMNGALFPRDYTGAGLWGTLAHSQAAVQFHHRVVAYLLTVVGIVMAWVAARSPLPYEAKLLAVATGVAIVFQALLGVITLVFGVPIWLGVAHQVAAAIVLSLAVAFAWRVRRP
jgi:cytochrome c oxidase assembly protein subunit 15